MSVNEFDMKKLNKMSYKIDKKTGNKYFYSRISPNNKSDNIILFMYNNEIIRIDNRGFLSQYYVDETHERSLRKIYGGYDKQIMEVVYEANMDGDILFVIENAGMIMWMPLFLMKKQKNKILERLESLKDKDNINIYMAIANSDSICNYKYVNDGMSVSLNMAIEYVNGLMVNNNYKK